MLMKSEVSDDADGAQHIEFNLSAELLYAAPERQSRCKLKNVDDAGFFSIRFLDCRDGVKEVRPERFELPTF